ncbi:MAG: RNA 2',3'-cyclic phosphodiesterase [Candidatus Wildermuthbacteria bacterium]|nr:RNA 2',3'-cyclic phosphodiesterase [Candidatus Wildermuthbacteria bacterium]
MMHRIFLAINLQKSVKEQLLAYQEKWPELPARWTKLENLHLTLVFYGNATDQELEEIKQKTKEVAKKHKPFSLKLSKIVYGPSVSQARMIWVVGNTTQELASLQQELAVTLERMEEREFSLHLTLARFNEWEFKKIDPEERPEVNEDISFEIPVNSVEIMGSKLKRGGAEYSILQSFALGEALA